MGLQIQAIRSHGERLPDRPRIRREYGQFSHEGGDSRAVVDVDRTVRVGVGGEVQLAVEYDAGTEPSSDTACGVVDLHYGLERITS